MKRISDHCTSATAAGVVIENAVACRTVTFAIGVRSHIVCICPVFGIGRGLAASHVYLAEPTLPELPLEDVDWRAADLALQGQAHSQRGCGP